MRVLVTGATGFVGSHIVPALVSAGHEVRTLARGARPSSLPAGVKVFQGSISDARSVRDAVRGVDACVHLVAIIVQRGEQTYQRVNVDGAKNLVRAMEEEGVSRLVHMSALGADAGSRFPYLRSKGEGEAIVEGSSLDWTILRPSALHGSGSGFFRPIVWTMRWMPFYPLPNGGRTRFQPLWIGDLARCVVRALEGAALKERVDCGGPQTMTFAEIVRAVMRFLGKKRLLLSVPVWAARPFAWIQSFRKDPLVTGEQLDMVVLDNACDPDAIKRAFGVEPAAFADTDLRWLASV
ncbi:MAG TPA: complex I NDUFA9 subunit family protein [Actinomycetota bacterium]|nr:complex I NDUFA9 subunit family protein [Actinomycetota bacterium]